MASDLGWTLVRSQFDSRPTRQVWVRSRFFCLELFSYSASVCSIHSVVHQCTLGAARTAVVHPLGHSLHPHHSIFLLVLGRQRFSWRARPIFLQVGLLCLWLVWSLFHLVRRSCLPTVCSVDLATSFPVRQVSAASPCAAPACCVQNGCIQSGVLFGRWVHLLCLDALPDLLGTLGG